MFTIKAKETIIAHCKKQISEYNFGKRSLANGTAEQQLIGIIGQSVVMDLFGLSKVDGKRGFDNGIDILFNNKKIHVKTMGRKTHVKPYYTNNFLKLQDYFESDVYIFCSYHKIKFELTICGWITKELFVNKRRFYEKGSIRTRSDGTTFKTFSDLYEIDNTDLNDVNNMEDLKQNLLKL